jgi:hypothetical protein
MSKQTLANIQSPFDKQKLKKRRLNLRKFEWIYHYWIKLLITIQKSISKLTNPLCADCIHSRVHVNYPDRPAHGGYLFGLSSG